MTIADRHNLSDEPSLETGAPFTLEVARHELTLFDESPPMIAAMLDDIRAARTRVWLETYIFADDAAGQAVAEALSERAQRGIDVRLIVDGVGSLSLPGEVLERLEASGVQVHVFHSFWHALWRWAPHILNRRDHRKLLIVDESIAYFGGMNIVDQGGSQKPGTSLQDRIAGSAGWRDVHVRMVGPQQSQCAAAFDWLWCDVHRLPRRPRVDWPIDRVLRAGGDMIAFFDCRPGLRHRRAVHVFVPLIRRARHEITVSMAYFLPIGRVLRELLKARRRGVRIRVIVPGQSDVPLVQYATRHFYSFLLKRGVMIFERQREMLHSKAIVVDGAWTVVGSCNLDPRSLRLNLEFMGVIRSDEMAKAVKRICRYEIRHSRRVTRRCAGKRNWWQRLVDRYAWSIRRWL